TLTVIHFLFFLMTLPPPISTLFPYTTLFRSTGSSTSTISCTGARRARRRSPTGIASRGRVIPRSPSPSFKRSPSPSSRADSVERSEEHTSELQSRSDLVCRLLLEKKKKRQCR